MSERDSPLIMAIFIKVITKKGIGLIDNLTKMAVTQNTTKMDTRLPRTLIF